MTRRKLLFFCDESSQVDDPWCAVAGLAMPKDVAAKATEDVRRIQKSHCRTGEVKWSKAKSFGGAVQRDFINYLFDQIALERMHFHIRFSPMAEYDHALSGPRKRIDTVSKSFYQLLLYRAVRLYHMHDLHIIADDGNCTSALPGKKEALNYRSMSYSKSLDPCICDIRCRSSASEPMLQLLDVSLGALAAMRNGRHNSPSFGVKRELAQLAFKRTGWPDITGNCPKSARNLSRWNVRPSMQILGRDPQP